MDTPNKEKTSKKGRESYSHAKADARRDKRRQEAEARQRTYDGLSIKARIALIKSRPGESKRETARINKGLEWAKAQAVTAAQAKKAPMTEAEKSAKAVKRAKAVAKHATQTA